MGMNTTNGTDSGMTMMGMMTPFLHCAGGDYLLFKEWMPTSGGAITGACIGLFVLAILDRWIHVITPTIVNRFRQRTSPSVQISTKPLEDEVSEVSTHRSPDSAEAPSVMKTRFLPPRTSSPFVAVVDMPRGIIYAFQRLLGFSLMLAVMTFNAAYIISILAGLTLGEILFGRISARVAKDAY